MKTILTRFHEFVADQCTAVDVESTYAEMLNETYSFADVGGPFASMTPSTVLESADPVAYRCGLLECGDRMRRANHIVEINECLYHVDDVESAKDEFIRELTQSGADETEIADAEGIEI